MPKRHVLALGGKGLKRLNLSTRGLILNQRHTRDAFALSYELIPSTVIGNLYMIIDEEQNKDIHVKNKKTITLKRAKKYLEGDQVARNEREFFSEIGTFATLTCKIHM